MFRHFHLQDNKLLIQIPESGLKPERLESYKAKQYFYWLKHKGVNVQFACSPEGQYKVGPYYVDCVIWKNQKIKKVIEFFGCYFHGCPSCFDDRDTIINSTNKSRQQVFNHSLKRVSEIQNILKVPVKIVWECDFEKQKIENIEMNKFLDNLDIHKPIRPRDAYQGGRVETLRMMWEAHGDELGYYADITSMYPFILKTEKFPINKCHLLVEEDIKWDLNSPCPYFGVACAKVVPPQNLLHPLLAIRLKNEKLTFALCKLCAINQSVNCTHSDNERSFIWTGCTLELVRAQSLGYKITKCFEVWDFPESDQYDPNIPGTGIFTSLINKFLTSKIENAGFPDHCKTEFEKIKYVNKMKSEAGIHLDYNKIQKNEPLKNVSKIMLNSFSGKLGQRGDRSQKQYIYDPTKYFNLLFNQDKQIQNIFLMSDNCLEVTYKSISEAIVPAKSQALVHALFVTAYGRLMLHEQMMKLGDRCLYQDTDSCIYFAGQTDYKIPFSDSIGGWSNEIYDNENIIGFVSTGPKSYSCKILNNDTNNVRYIVKCKGFSLNGDCNINYNSMKKMVIDYLNGARTTIDTERFAIKQTKGRLLKSITDKKIFSVVMNKRYTDQYGKCYPFGYKES
jgi:hypothetical protein